MAAIDKLWINKENLLEGLSWICNLEERYKKTFINSRDKIKDYLRYDGSELNNL